MSEPRLWKTAVRAWQDPKLKLDLKGVLALIDPTPEQEEEGLRGYCPDCVELALVEGGRWLDPSAIPTTSGHPERIARVCDSCDYRGCEDHVEDHSDDTGHWSHGFCNMPRGNRHQESEVTPRGVGQSAPCVRVAGRLVLPVSATTSCPRTAPLEGRG